MVEASAVVGPSVAVGNEEWVRHEVVAAEGQHFGARREDRSGVLGDDVDDIGRITRVEETVAVVAESKGILETTRSAPSRSRVYLRRRNDKVPP